MGLEQWTAVADIVAGFGLIISLIFVGWQMRINGSATRSEYIVGHMRHYDEILSFFLTTPELTDAWILAEEDINKLTHRERLQYRIYMMKMFNHADVWANLDRRYFVGEFGQSRYEEHLRTLVASPARRKWYETHRASFTNALQRDISRAENQIEINNPPDNTSS